MISASGISEYSISDFVFAPPDDSAFRAFLAEATGERCYLVELDGLSLAVTGGRSTSISDSGISELSISDASGGVPAGLETLRYATHEYVTHAADAPADTPYSGRVEGPPEIDRRIAGRNRIGGLTEVRAEVSLVNSDGALDLLQRNYALEGRRARILIGRPPDQLTGAGGDARADFGTYFTGILKNLTIDEGVVHCSLSDGSAKLRRLVNEAVYAGTGGLEGGDDLKGKNKPVALGPAPNVPAPLVDAAKLIYQVHDGVVNDVPAVYDRGIALTRGADYSDAADMDTTAPAAGFYRVWRGGGYFRLGATPAGTVTADVEGDADPSYVNTTATIVLRLLAVRLGLASDEIDSTSFLNLDVVQPAVVGDWYGASPVTCAEAIDRFLYGAGCFGGFNRYGTFEAGLVTSPLGQAEEWSFDELEIRSVERVPLPAEVEPIVWRVGVGWQRNYTVQTDLAAAVSAARRTFCAQAVRVSSTEDGAILSRHLLAQALGPIEALYALEADAQAERDRQMALWGVRRGAYRVTVPAAGLLCDLGSVGRLSHPRFGWMDGVSASVLAHNAQGTEIQLTVLV